MQVTRLAKLGTGQTTLSISEGANMMLACFRKLSGVGISDFEGIIVTYYIALFNFKLLISIHSLALFPNHTMAAELIGGAFLSLTGCTVMDFHGRKLDETLLSIEALVDDAEQKKFRDPRVRGWHFAAKDVVFDTEDLLDEIDYELSKCQVESEFQTFTFKVTNVGSIHLLESCVHLTLQGVKPLTNIGLKSIKPVQNTLKERRAPFNRSFNRKIDSGMKQVLDKLEYLACQKDALGSKVSQKLPSTSLVVGIVIYGRDNKKQMIFNWLTSETHSRVGTTTLTQHVYNYPRMEEAKFDIKAWVCVSDDFDVLTVTRTILEAITTLKDDGGNLEIVHRRLKEKLVGKRFLYILDDGSRILVTTCSEKVASIVQSCKVHQLKQLQEIYASKGLPLALKTIGSLLHSKSSILEWKNVSISKIWDLTKEDCEIIPALFLSYHHLPSHLKRCFSFCALFPKEYEFDKECLILLWIAKKFLQCPLHSKSLEEVGKQYFHDLLSRSFFEQSSISEAHFAMHDLFNNLAKHVCGNICFRFKVDKQKYIPKTTRHFSFAIKDIRYFDGFGSLIDAKRLHTFFPIPRSGITIFHKFPRKFKISIHDFFSKFMFLHFLSLYCCLELREVRDSVPMLLGKLKNLQLLSTFCVRKSSKFNVEQLGGLNLHGRLSIEKLQNIVYVSDALAMDLKNKTYLFMEGSATFFIHHFF
ncbi:putative disease resistance RPP13-like protein 1 [Glycine max]|nr:putative disease resistance RPP13-like protein 1 [Glycine max]